MTTIEMLRLVIVTFAFFAVLTLVIVALGAIVTAISRAGQKLREKRGSGLRQAAEEKEEWEKI